MKDGARYGDHLRKEPFFWLSVRRPTLGKVRNHNDEPDGQFMEDDMMERLLALVLAGTLVAPQIGLAGESELNDGWARQDTPKFSERLSLPPIPYLDTMPWMNFGSQPKGPGIDTLLLPDFNIAAMPTNAALAANNALNTRQLLAGTGIK